MDLTKVTRFDRYTVGDILRLDGTAHLKKLFIEDPERLRGYLNDLESICGDKSIIDENFKDNFVNDDGPLAISHLVSPFQAVQDIYKFREIKSSAEFVVDDVAYSKFIGEAKSNKSKEIAINLNLIAENIDRIEEHNSTINEYEKNIQDMLVKIDDLEANQLALFSETGANSIINQLRRLSVSYHIIFKDGNINLLDKQPIIMKNDMGALGLKTYNMGYYCYRVNSRFNVVKIMPFWGNRAASNGGVHPHISGSGSHCTGEASYRLERYRDNYRLDEIMRTTRVLLSTYNPSSPYRGINSYKASGFYVDEVVLKIWCGANDCVPVQWLYSTYSFPFDNSLKNPYQGRATEIAKLDKDFITREELVAAGIELNSPVTTPVIATTPVVDGLMGLTLDGIVVDELMEVANE